MFSKAFVVTIISLLAAVLLLSGTACEGAGALDRETREAFDLKLKEWNENGTFPIPDTSVDTKGYLKEWDFRYSKLSLVFDSQVAHPVDSRSVMETIGVEWWRTYPENIKPRFILRVFAYKDLKSNDAEWGMCKIKRDGTPEVHWYATDVY
jgi:hypothetical protein